MKEIRTQVAIIGAGPAGLFLGHLLNQIGVESVIVERRDREYVQARVRAGVLEHGIVKMLIEAGIGDRLQREGLEHKGVELRVDQQSYRIDFDTYADGKSITVYGQQEVVKDLIEARISAGLPLHFDAEVTAINDITSPTPSIECEIEGEGAVRITADFIAGCDGSLGIANRSIPASAVKRYERIYPYSWLGILAEAAPATEELIYCRHERGFALYSMRSPSVSRLYLGVGPSDSLDEWRDERIWDELDRRLATEEMPHVNRGHIFERGITSMRNIVITPLRYGNLILAGDASHIVPPTGAKGMNAAIGDIRDLFEGLRAHYTEGTDAVLHNYETTALRRIWRAEEFSSSMTQMLHPNPVDPFENEVQLSRLRDVVRTPELLRVVANNYTNLNCM
jgi:p-hydroxybenzoate 3-monooxygenase